MRRAFTLIELLVVISIIALLIGILLPALGAARRTARQIQNSTQLRGMHQGAFTYAQSNKTWMPGITKFDANSTLNSFNVDVRTLAGLPNSSKGAHAEGRFILMLEEDLVTPEYLISPAEISPQVEAWDPQAADGTYQRADNQYISSYAISMLLRPVGGNVTPAVGRGLEWRDNANGQVLHFSDRMVSGIRINSATHTSIWTSGNQPGWQGSLTFGDNSTEFVNDSQTENKTNYTLKGSTTPDNIFDFQPTGGNQPDAGYNHAMITHNNLGFVHTAP